jgi:hypothetical protein
MSTKKRLTSRSPEGRRDGEVRHYGVIASDLEPLDKVVRALRAPDRQLHFVYEAGPCGFGIYRISRTFGAAIDEFATVEE